MPQWSRCPPLQRLRLSASTAKAPEHPGVRALPATVYSAVHIHTAYSRRPSRTSPLFRYLVPVRQPPKVDKSSSTHIHRIHLLSWAFAQHDSAIHQAEGRALRDDFERLETRFLEDNALDLGTIPSLSVACPLLICLCSCNCRGLDPLHHRPASLSSSLEDHTCGLAAPRWTLKFP